MLYPQIYEVRQFNFRKICLLLYYVCKERCTKDKERLHFKECRAKAWASKLVSQPSRLLQK
jgi:hypothetical protein